MSQSLEIVELHPLDPEALELIRDSNAELASVYGTQEPHALSPEQLVDVGVIFLVARRDGVAIACGGLAPIDDYGELKRIFTRPGARGTGAARVLIDALERVARARGLASVRLETGVDSDAALGLYRRLGYHRRGPFGDYTENGSSVFMEKRLG